MFNAAIGLGGTKTYITAIEDTVLKRLPLDSQVLLDTQKMDFLKGDRLEIIGYSTSDNHYKILVLSPNLDLIGGWYAFIPHVKIDDPDVKELISLEQLLAIATRTPAYKLEALITPLNAAMVRYQINSRIRICHFIAQVAHESDGFNTCCEYADGSAYEWRDDLGNTQEGDGVRFKGRGLIQVTGRENYHQVSTALNIDFLNNPPLLEEPVNACLSAGWYWSSRDLNPLADADEVYKITLIINGGYNGINCRVEYLDKAKEVFGI